jgi:hypothetical protein
MTKMLVRSRVLLSIAFTGAAFCFLPILMGTDSSIESTSLRQALGGSFFISTSMAACSLMVPLVIDAVFDLLQRRRSYKTTRQDSLNLAERIIFLIGIIVVPVVAYLPAETKNLALIYNCCRRGQLTLMAGVIGATMHRYDPRAWNGLIILVGTVLFSIGQIIWAFWFTDLEKPYFLKPLSYTLTYGHAILFLCLSFHWLLWDFMREYEAIPSEDRHNPALGRSHLYFPVLYIFTTSVGVAQSAIVSLVSGDVTMSAEKGLVLHNIALIILEISIAIFSMRQIKEEITEVNMFNSDFGDSILLH